MDSLLTPTTALLYSYLELDAFESPGPSRKDTPTDRDVFSHAFGKHNSMYLEPGISESGTLAEHDKYVGPEDNVGVVAAGQYITPPGTNEFSNLGARNCSIDSVQLFGTPPSPMTAIEKVPDSRKDEELLGSFSEHSPQANIFEVGNSSWQINHFSEGIFGPSEPNNTAMIQDAWIGKSSVALPEAINDQTLPILPPDKIKRRRQHKRKPLNEEAKALKHTKFLERNRIAADNCRKRKKERNASLEERGMILDFRNAELKEMKDELVSEVQRLKRELSAMVNDRAEKTGEQAIHIDGQLMQMDEQVIQMDDQIFQTDEQVIQMDGQVFQTDEQVILTDDQVFQTDEQVIQTDDLIFQTDEQILQKDEQPIQIDSQIIQMDELLIQKDETSQVGIET